VKKRTNGFEEDRKGIRFGVDSGDKDFDDMNYRGDKLAN